MARLIAVQTDARPGRQNQPAKSSSNVAGSRRLRRRLSRIFQREMALSGLSAYWPLKVGTLGRSQRINANRRVPSDAYAGSKALKCEGKSSISSMSETRPARACSPSIRSWLKGILRKTSVRGTSCNTPTS